MKPLALKRDRTYSVAFRSTVGRDAAEASKTNPQSYLSDIVRKHFDFEDIEWDHKMSDEEKSRYREQKQEIEKVKKTILQARKDWESGKLQGQESAPASAVRMRGSDPPQS